MRLEPASHEDSRRPGVWKRVLFPRELLPEGRAQMLNWAELPGGSSFAPHYHEDMDEIFVIVQGSAEMRVGKDSITLAQGDAVLVACREIHSMTNRTNEKVEYLVIGLTRDQGGRTICVERE